MASRIEAGADRSPLRDRGRGAEAPDADRRVRYRCCSCALAFAPPEPGAAPCPRCQSVGGHERIEDGEPDRSGGDERE